MNYQRITGLILIIGSCVLGSACSRTTLDIPITPETTVMNEQDEDAYPLYFINNVEVKDINQAKFEPDNIENMYVLKPSDTNDLVSAYGPKAKNGIIFVTTKSNH